MAAHIRSSTSIAVVSGGFRWFQGLFLFSVLGGPDPQTLGAGAHYPRDKKRSAQLHACAFRGRRLCGTEHLSDRLEHRVSALGHWSARLPRALTKVLVNYPLNSTRR